MLTLMVLDATSQPYSGMQKALNTHANVYLICNQLTNQDDQQGLLTSILSMMSTSGRYVSIS